LKRLKHLLIGAVFALVWTATAFAQTSVVQSVENVGNKVATYYSASSFTLDTTPNVVWTITGSSTRTVYIKSISITCTMTTAGQVNISVKKYSSAASGGTAVATTEVASDSGNSANTAAVAHYTADPTAGTAVGTLSIVSLSILAPATAVANQPQVWRFGEKEDQYLVLRGTAQQVGLDFGGATTTGGVCQVSAVWMEK